MMSNDIYEGLLQRILGLAKPSPSERARAIDGALERARQEAGDIKPTTGPFTPTGSSAEELAASPIGQAAQRKRQADQTAAIQNIRRGERAADVFRNLRLDPRVNKPILPLRQGETQDQAIRRIQAEKKAAEQLPDAFKDIGTPSGSSIKQGIDSSRVSGRSEPGGDLSTINLPTSKREPMFDPDTIGQPVELPAAAKPGLVSRIGQRLKPDISPLEASLYLHGGLGTGAYIANKRSNQQEPARTTQTPAPEPVPSKTADKTADDDFDKEMDKLRETLRKVRYNG